MKKFFEYRRGQFVSASEISSVNAQLANYEKSRNEWCVVVRSGNANCPLAVSKTIGSGEEAAQLATRLVRSLTDDEAKVFSFPEFTEY